MLSEGLCCSDCLGYPYDTCTMHVDVLCLIGVLGCSGSSIRTTVIHLVEDPHPAY